jgi:hypothetical protein
MRILVPPSAPTCVRIDRMPDMDLDGHSSRDVARRAFWLLVCCYSSSCLSSSRRAFLALPSVRIGEP